MTFASTVIKVATNVAKSTTVGLLQAAATIIPMAIYTLISFLTNENPTETAIRQRQETQRRIDAAEAAERRALHLLEQTKEEHQAAVDDANRVAEQAVREKHEQVTAARVAREEAERARATEEASRRALLAREEALRVATTEADKARQAEKEVSRRLMQGIRPEVWPTVEQLEENKRKHQCVDGYFHVAVAGVCGSGKSSLINAFLGRPSRTAGAAATGIVETTSVVGRYPDPNPNQRPLIWYDIPGAGTLNVSDWQYFNDQGLYVFDCIIVLFDNRFTATDIAILKNCARFKIPSYIVRSKSNQNIRNVALEMGYDEEDPDFDPTRRQKIFEAAQKTYIDETRQSVAGNLQEASLPQQKVYMVSNVGMLSVISLQPKGRIIDELQLLEDIFKEGAARRSGDCA